MIVNNRGRVLKYLLQTLLEAVNIVVDQVHLADLGLLDQTNQSQALVHLPQVQNYVLLWIVLVFQPDDTGAFLVKFAAAARLLVHAVNASHIN